MLKYQWEKLTISSYDDFERLKSIVQTVKPTIGGLDTETNGLHIINCEPFIVQFGFLDEAHRRGFTFAVDLENTTFANEVLSFWHSVAETLEIYSGQNIKYDLHMMQNEGHPYTKDNITDLMFYIRYGHDALHPEEGGPPMGLKDYATRYIDSSAKLHEKKLKKQRTAIAKDLNMRLKIMLNNSNAKLPEGVKAKSFTLKVVQDLFKDPIFDVSDLPEDIRAVYLEWLHSLPLYLQHKVQSLVEADMIRYNDLNRADVTEYAHYDIIWLLESLMSLKHVVKNRGQEFAVKLENACIYPWMEMERVGFEVDKEYLEESRIRLKQYIKERREVLYSLAGKELTVGQHAEVKNILEEKFNITVQSTGNEPLNILKNTLPEDSDARAFIDVLQELRTLEKWYSAYIIRFQKELKFNDRLYTTINQVGTVSGRVTSDFQQFPKKPIKTINGEELFHPRKIVKSKHGIVYLDYSQIELRFQALYTLLVGHPDFNMCRAYMPYDCVSKNGIEFDPLNPTHIKNWNKEWFHKENPEEHWTPVDVHAATTTAATGKTKDDPEFSSLRSTIGKRVNFAKNYGAELGRIRQMFPDKTYDECVVINDAYYKAFPGVKEYHSYCAQQAAYYSNTTNLFGVKYYNVSGHKLKNLLVQGSAAYFLKLKIIELYHFTKKHNLKSRFQMQIHDELSWEYDPADSPKIFFYFKAIMENWEDGHVPIVADMEATNKTWADKQEIETIAELIEILEEKQNA